MPMTWQWDKSEDGVPAAYVNEASDLQWPVGCAVATVSPCCRRVVPAVEWKTKTRDGDVLAWTALCPGCGSALTVFND